MRVRSPLAAAALAATLALTACTTSSETASSPAPADRTDARPTGELAFEDGAGVDINDDDLVVFIAAGERMLVDGPYEGVIHESPEIYLAVARSFCSRLDDGMDVNRIVADFAVEAGFDLTADHDRTLIGSVLGSGVESLCPRHRDLL